MSVKKLSKQKPATWERMYPQDVEDSVKGILEDLGCANAAAFTRRFDLADIVTVFPAVRQMVNAKPGIRSPCGLLWRMLEARERRLAPTNTKEDKNVTTDQPIPR